MLSHLSYTPVFTSGRLLFPFFSTVLKVLRSFRNRGAFKIKQQYSLRLTPDPFEGFPLRLTFCQLSICLQMFCLHRKEVIQPHLPIRLPCYDFTPVANPTFGSALLAVKLLTSGITGSHGVTGGVYKARERIHRGMLIRDY